jgi:hypothetical protein
MTNLKSKIKQPTTVLDFIERYRYLYTHAKTSVYIQAYYVRHFESSEDHEGKSMVEWSMYHKEAVLLENQISALSDFTDMINSYEWEDQSFEIVPCK